MSSTFEATVMTGLQRAIEFGVRENTEMTSIRAECTSDSRGIGLFEAPAPAPGTSTLEDWLDDPRVGNLTDAAFRVACFLRSGRSIRRPAALQSVIAELAASGLFSAEQVATIGGRLVDPAGDLPAVRNRRGAVVPAEWEQRFKRFYDAYGFRRAPGDARDSWYRLERVALESPVDLELIITAAAKACREAAMRPNQLRKRPSTWLNQNCWEEDIDGGAYTPACQAMIDVFNSRCPRAEVVTTYSPARADAIRAALNRMDLDRWKSYFDACIVFTSLFDYIKGPVPITAALSPEMERKVREAVLARNGGGRS